MQLHDPWALLLLLLLPLLARGRRRSAPPTLHYPGAGGGARRRSGAARALALAAAGAARRRAGPVDRRAGAAAARQGRDAVYAEGIDIMLAVDLSGSMLAEDFQLDGQRASRLDAVKAVVREFLDKRPDDRVGLVLFARARTRRPADARPRLAAENLERAQIGMIEDGTAIGSALATRGRPAGELGGQEQDRHPAHRRPEQRRQGAAADRRREPPRRSATASTPSAPAPAAWRRIRRSTRSAARSTSTCRSTSTRTPCSASPRRPAAATSAPPTPPACSRSTTRSTSSRPASQEGLQYLDYYELYVWLALPALLLLAGEAVLAQTWLRVLP